MSQCNCCDTEGDFIQTIAEQLEEIATEHGQDWAEKCETWARENGVNAASADFENCTWEDINLTEHQVRNAVLPEPAQC